MDWICPECGRSFAHVNQSHSCGRFELEDHFRGKPAHIVALYHALEQAVLACGSCQVQPAQTTILIRRRVTFVSLKLRRRYITVGMRLARELVSERISRTFEFRPGLYEYRFRFDSIEQIDDEVNSWLCEAWQEAG